MQTMDVLYVCVYVLSSFIDWAIGFCMSQNTLDAKVEREIVLLQQQ